MKAILRKPRRFVAILAIFSLAASPLMKSRAVLPRSNEASVLNKSSLQSAQDVYQVEVIVLNLSNINLTAGTYSMDFYIMFTCQHVPCTYEPNWDILNSTSTFIAEDQGVIFVFVKDLIIPYNILISSNEGTPWWPHNLEWLAKWLDYAKYLPDGYFQ